MRAALLSLCVVFSLMASGQKFFISLGGIVTDHYTAQPLRDVLVHIETIGSSRYVNDIVTKRDGSYRATLDKGLFYSVTYSKAGFVSKAIHIDARNVPERPDVPFYDMDVQMTLFEPMPDFDISFFREPVGRAEYKSSVRTINWDNDFSQKKERELAMLMKEYNKIYRGYYERTGSRPPIIIADSILVFNTDSMKDVKVLEDILSKFQPMDSLTSYYVDTMAAPAMQVESVRGGFFTVQVGVYSRPVPLNAIFNISPLNSELMDNGNIRYTSGMFNSLEEAGKHQREMIANGVDDAFIVAYFNGKRIPIEDALYLFAKFRDKIEVQP